MKKVLFTANLDSFFIKFLIPQLKYFKDNGYEVHVASKNQDIEIPYCDKKFNVSFARSFNIKDNLKSYQEIKKILLENDYDLISCHTPFGGVIPRLALKHIKNYKGRVVYTAHGFHFFKGAPLLNWLIYYPVEKYLAKYTDALITINKEDYELACKKMKTDVYYIPGIGVDENKFNVEISKEKKSEIKKKLKVTDENFILIFPGEINNNKNQVLLIDTLEILKKHIPKIALLLPGNDLLNGKLLDYSREKGLEKNIRFLGFRKDIPELLAISDLSVSSSKREGLPINILEAMYVGKPLVVTNCRGNRDLIEDGTNGFLVNNNSAPEFAEKILKIYNDKKTSSKFVNLNKERVKKYLIENVLDEIVKIYMGGK